MTFAEVLRQCIASSIEELQICQIRILSCDLYYVLQLGRAADAIIPVQAESCRGGTGNDSARVYSLTLQILQCRGLPLSGKIQDCENAHHHDKRTEQ